MWVKHFSKIYIIIIWGEAEKIGISYSKITYLKNFSQALKTKSVSFYGINELDNESIIKVLTSVKGIGQVDCRNVFDFSLGRKDAFSNSDGSLQRAINVIYGEGKKMPKDEIKGISDAWKPYRTYTSLYLWDLIN